MSIEMLHDCILLNKNVDLATQNINIKESLREARLLTITIGLNDLLYQLSLNNNLTSSKIDEIASEQKKQEDDYNALLKDYKDVVIHSSFKPLNNSDTGAKLPSAGYQSLDNIFDDAIKHAMEAKN